MAATKCAEACHIGEQSRPPVASVGLIRVFEDVERLDGHGEEQHAQPSRASRTRFHTVNASSASIRRVDVCPVEATWKEKDGIVVVDYNWCIGCLVVKPRIVVSCGGSIGQWSSPPPRSIRTSPISAIASGRRRDGKMHLLLHRTATVVCRLSRSLSDGRAGVRLTRFDPNSGNSWCSRTNACSCSGRVGTETKFLLWPMCNRHERFPTNVAAGLPRSLAQLLPRSGRHCSIPWMVTGCSTCG